MSEFNNGLSDAQLERLAILAEECGELLQIIGKIIRHGYGSCDPIVPNAPINRTLLERELGDVLYAAKLMTENGDISGMAVEKRAEEKQVKIQPYLHHQRKAPNVR